MIGRDTQGVRVIRLNDGDLVTDVAVVESEDLDPDALESAAKQKAEAAGLAEGVSALDGEASVDGAEPESEAPETPEAESGADGDPA